MEALAQQHEVKGFEYSDYDFFATQARKYYMRILEILMMAAVVVVTITFIARQRGKRISAESFVAMLVFLGGLFYYLNFLSFGQYGIVNHNQLALMSGPSAGSNLLRTLPEGNRLNLQSEVDIWYKVEYQDTIGFVRKDHVLVPNQ